MKVEVLYLLDKIYSVLIQKLRGNLEALTSKYFNEFYKYNL